MISKWWKLNLLWFDGRPNPEPDEPTEPEGDGDDDGRGEPVGPGKPE